MMSERAANATVGVISDTHGVLSNRAVEILRGATRIIHAGDVGDPLILDRLRALAPLTAVRGNMDRGDWACDLPASTEVEVCGRWLHVRHIVDEVDLDPVAAGFAAVIHGHSHRAKVEERRGVLYVNPGSAGQRRFKLPVTVALIDVTPHSLQARIVEL
jgi:putative phosphoesterase